VFFLKHLDIKSYGIRYSLVRPRTMPVIIQC